MHFFLWVKSHPDFKDTVLLENSPIQNVLCLLKN